MHFFQALVLGIVEGLTEFLPISSTAHMILAARAMGVGDAEFAKSFEIVIQLGAMLAVAVVFAQRILSRKNEFFTMIVGFVPTGIVGLLVYPYLKKYLLGNIPLIACTLFLGGVVFLLVERMVARRETARASWITYRDAVFIGAAQCLAIVPGVSRSGSTIVAAMLLGYARTVALEFSFVLALPTMAAATSLELLKSYKSVTLPELPLLAVGFVTAFVVALVTVRWFTRYVASHDFRGFAWYRILLSLVIGALLVVGF